MTYEALLKLATKKTLQHQKEVEAAKLLLIEKTKKTPSDFYLSLREEVDSTFEKEYLEALDQYLIDHIPVQHLIGHAYFFGYPFIVNSHVLIPRSETERLVERVLSLYDQYFEGESIRVLDIGTGSGCIGLTLSLEEKRMDVTASDISIDALEVTKANQEQLKSKATIIRSDLFQSIEDTFDFIISNPPYIPDDEIVEDIVSKEPQVALYGGPLGVSFYEKILKEARTYLNSKGLIAFEHGYQQRQLIFNLAKTYFPESIIIQEKDLSAKDRFTFIGIGGVLS